MTEIENARCNAGALKAWRLFEAKPSTPRAFPQRSPYDPQALARPRFDPLIRSSHRESDDNADTRRRDWLPGLEFVRS